MSLIVQPVVDRLKLPTIVGGARHVEGVGGLQAAINVLKGSFELFVVRTAGSAGPSTTATMVTRQTVLTQFEVIGAFQMAQLRTTPDLIDTASADILARLVGWSHPAGDEPTEFRSERVLRSDFTQGQLFWSWGFSFNRTIQG